MDEGPSTYPDLSHQTDFRLKRINKIKDRFVAKIHE